MTNSALCDALTDAFGEVYGGRPEPIGTQHRSSRVEELEARFASWDWDSGVTSPSVAGADPVPLGRRGDSAFGGKGPRD